MKLSDEWSSDTGNVVTPWEWFKHIFFSFPYFHVPCRLRRYTDNCQLSFRFQRYCKNNANQTIKILSFLLAYFYQMNERYYLTSIKTAILRLLKCIFCECFSMISHFLDTISLNKFYRKTWMYWKTHYAKKKKENVILYLWSTWCKTLCTSYTTI